MIKQFLETGKITGTHALKGEIRVQPWADSPEFLAEFDTLYLDKGAKKIEVASARVNKNMLIMKIKGIDTIEEAEKLRNKILYLNRDDVELDEGAYFIQDILGIDVFDIDTGDKLGVLSDVTETGANDVYHIKAENGKEYLIPAIPDILKEVNAQEGYIKIFKMKGLFDDED